jgi:hypothetical protein
LAEDAQDIHFGGVFKTGDGPCCRGINLEKLYLCTEGIEKSETTSSKFNSGATCPDAN